MRSQSGMEQETGGNGRSTLLEPGRNCWRVAEARRATMLFDAEEYFAALDNALRSAKRSIFIIGWDFDGRIQLRPQDGGEALRLADFLRCLVEERPSLEVRILVWSFSAIHAPSAALPLMLGAPWQDHPRIRLRLDTRHPIHAAHHQKIVLIDDSLAFVGGMDLTIARWDSNLHAATHPLRLCPDGTPYGPVHDLQMAVDGPVARVVARVAHERWRKATGEEIPLERPVERWPKELAPGFANVPMGVARTEPGLADDPPVEEAARLIEDMVHAAERSIYIEAQYFTAKRLRRILGESLARPRGPEIVVVCTRHANGVIERFIMGANRERLLRVLKRADRYDRLRIYYPVVEGEKEECYVLVHAKLMIVDDTVLRIGSTNMNNRSMGLDTECDLVVEADGPETRTAIARYRDRLLAEHMDVDPAAVSAAVERKGGSLIRAIESLNLNERGLRPMHIGKGPTHSFPGTRLLDPERPFPFVERLRAWWRRPFAHRVPAGFPARERKSSDRTRRTLPNSKGRRK